MSDHFFLPLITVVVYFYSPCDERGKLGCLVITNQCFDKYLEQSMSLNRIPRGDKLLFKLNEPYFSALTPLPCDLAGRFAARATLIADRRDRV